MLSQMLFRLANRFLLVSHPGNALERRRQGFGIRRRGQLHQLFLGSLQVKLKLSNLPGCIVGVGEVCRPFRSQGADSVPRLLVNPQGFDVFWFQDRLAPEGSKPLLGLALDLIALRLHMRQIPAVGSVGPGLRRQFLQ